MRCAHFRKEKKQQPCGCCFMWLFNDVGEAPAEFDLAAVLQGVVGKPLGDGGLDFGDLLVQQRFICIPAKENVIASEGYFGICGEQSVFGSVLALAHFLGCLYGVTGGNDIFVRGCDDDTACGLRCGRGGEARGHECVQ